MPTYLHETPIELVTTTSHKYQSDFARRYFDSGEARGEANAVLHVLEHRGVAISDEHRAIITGCTDHAQLKTWLLSAGTADKIQDLGDQCTG